jgi:DNA-binding NarL/FixJ family response regulator
MQTCDKPKSINPGRIDIVKIRVCLVEDDVSVREIFADWLKGAADMTLACAYGDAESAMASLAKVKPDVVLMDINLPGQSGIDCVRQMKLLLPETQFMMVTVYQDADNIFHALSAGATGYLLKQTSRANLLAAVREVHGGGSPISSCIARKVVQVFQQPAPASSESNKLSAREQGVLELLAQGYLLKEIARQLGVSVHTVGTYTRRIYEKLHVHSRSQAVAFYTAHQPHTLQAPVKATAQTSR